MVFSYRLLFMLDVGLVDSGGFACYDDTLV